MKVTVVCFGAMRDYLPGDIPGNRAEVEIDDGATVADLIEQLRAPHRLVFSVLVDGARSGTEARLDGGAEVTLMPPFAGGAPQGGPAAPRGRGYSRPMENIDSRSWRE